MPPVLNSPREGDPLLVAHFESPQAVISDLLSTTIEQLPDLLEPDAVPDPLTVQLGPKAKHLMVPGNASSLMFHVQLPGTIQVRSLETGETFSMSGSNLEAPGLKSVIVNCLLPKNLKPSNAIEGSVLALSAANKINVIPVWS